MMRVYSYVMAAFAAMIVSCSGNNPEDPEERNIDTNEPQSSSTVFTVTLDGDIPIKWPSGAKIKVCDPTTGANYGVADLTSGEGSSEAVFTLGKSLAKGTKVCLVYPSDKTLGSNTSLYSNLSSDGSDNPDLSGIIFASTPAFEAAEENKAALMNPLAAVKVVPDIDKVVGYRLSSVTMRCSNVALCGTYTLEKQKLTLKISDGQSSVCVNLKDKPVIDPSGSYVTLLCFPADCSGKSVTFELSMESGSGLQTSVSFNAELGRLSAGKITEVKLSSLESSEYVLTDVSYYWWRNGKYVTAPSRTISGMNYLDKLAEATDRDQWGGCSTIKPTRVTSTNNDGYWHTGYYNDKKVFVDPDGNVALLAGFNFVCPDPNIDNCGEPVRKYYLSKFSSVDDWAGWCAPTIADLGFNFFSNSPRRINYYDNMPSPGISMTESARKTLIQGNGKVGLSQCENLFLLRSFYWSYASLSGKSFSPSDQSEFSLMFDPDYKSYIKSLAGIGAALFKDDKSFIGYYTDNELPFVGTTDTYPVAMTLKSFLSLTTDKTDAGYYRCNSYCRQWALDWMQSKYGTQTYSPDMESDFLSAIADYYFKTASDAIREADPNHLILGSRIHSDAKDTKGIVEACARYCDVVSFNFYAYWDITCFPTFNSYPSWTGDRPCLVSEFYTKDSSLKAPDGTLYKNHEGAGWIVDSQKDRGIFYQNNIIHFIEDNQIAGWQYFKWTDDYSLNSNTYGWVNKGVVVPDYSGLHEGCTKLMREVNINQYQLLKYYH